ncbi:MAG: phosphodiester glycosidase family protein [Oscillospiraceae bacterium]|nr:phosphodiester glycosidase family protein [Oscillospiraceae bacterium]
MKKVVVKQQKSIKRLVLRALTVIFTIIFLLVSTLLVIMWILARGPSPTAQRLFVMSVNETSAIGWLANIYLSQAEIDNILSFSEDDNTLTDTTDTSMITINPQRPNRSEILGLTHIDDNITHFNEDEDLDCDGLELVEVFRNGYKGFMLIIHDPTRIFLGSPPSFGGNGVKLTDMVANAEAVAGINGGGFYDPGGHGPGGTPTGFVFDEGVLRWGANSGRTDIVGIDADGILHVGFMTPTEATQKNIKYSVAFGPTLISNGVVNNNALGRSGLNPRTAIGQRSDGAILMLVVEGRQIDSIGATYDDLIEVMLSFDAVNAYNLDGGSSAQMIYYGERVIRDAHYTTTRAIPTGFLVRGLDD